MPRRSGGPPFRSYTLALLACGGAVRLEPAEQLRLAGFEQGAAVALRPGMDSAPVREATATAGDETLERRRRQLRGVEMRLQKAGEGDHGVEPAEIRGFDRAGDSETPANRVADDRVDRRCRGDAGCPQRPGFAQRRELDAVADEAGDLLVDDHRLLANRAEDLADARDERRCGLGAGGDLDQRDELRRV